MSPVPHAVHSIIGYGVRLCKDLGVHRQATYSCSPNAEGELKKRAFWWAKSVCHTNIAFNRSCLIRCLVAYDRSMSDKMGRPYNVHDEEWALFLRISPNLNSNLLQFWCGLPSGMWWWILVRPKFRSRVCTTPRQTIQDCCVQLSATAYGHTCGGV